MAHFAKLDTSNTVTQVIVIGNKDCLDSQGNESEAVGIAFCQSLFGADTIWKQTSYNSNFRYRYAGIGCTYSEEYDVFLLPKPYPSWVLNTSNYEWEAPVPYPEDGHEYKWDEETQSWVRIN
jgi:hypothetical protein